MLYHRFRGFMAALVLSFLSMLAWADGSSVIPVADFAKHSELGAPSLSPDGEHLAVSVHDVHDADGGGRYEIGVFHLPDMKPVSRVMMDADLLPAQVVWVSNTRLLVTQAIKRGSLEEPQAGGDIIAIDYQGKHQIGIYAANARVGHNLPSGLRTISGVPPEHNGHFYLTISTLSTLSASGPGKGVTQIYDVDASDGSAKKLSEIQAIKMQFLVHHGAAILAYGFDNQNRPILFRSSAYDQGVWVQTPMTGSHMEPLGVSADGASIYWRYSADGGPYALAVTNGSFEHPKILAQDNESSIDNVQWTPFPHHPFAVTLKVGRPKTVYVDDDNWARIHKAISEEYPDYLISFTSISADGSRIIVHAQSDRDPGFYALFNLNPVSLTTLYREKPWINPAQMAAREPISFKAGDGLGLDGYLTRPTNGKHLGMILLPHGGPLGLRDHWEYDSDAQFLASRGYAVLQVNYRGSDGRGSRFMAAGYKQFNTGIQQDLLAGVRWAIDQGYADKNRVCVFGSSFGGYSALWTPILAPGMFKCAIDFAGVSDYAVELDHSDTERSFGGRSYFEQAVGTDEETIKAVSPIYHLDQFNVPVLIVHGEKDPRVPLKNATELRDALEKAGKPYEYLVKPKELHGFYSEANNEDFLVHMQAFLDKYIGS